MTVFLGSFALKLIFIAKPRSGHAVFTL